jgi:ABC-2 type transport system ATP-binding protein
MNLALSIETEGLTRRFGSLLAVDHLSFEVKEGEVFGLLGPNGAGKTTTIRMLACLISPSEGSGRVAGFDVVKDASRVRETVGILTENPSLYERLTAYENMDFFAEAYNLSVLEEKQHRIRDLLEFFDLWERRNEKVVKFSRGMKQKLAIARALVHNPPILFLDEPTVGLDPESAKNIRELIESLSRQEKHTILLSTHHLEDAEKLCSRVMIVSRGKNVIVGTPEELRDRVSGEPALKVTLVGLDQKIVESVRTTEHVLEVSANGSRSELTITVDDVKSTTPEVVRSIVHADGRILSVNVCRPTLEDAYLKLVKEERP